MAALEASKHPAATNRRARHWMSTLRVPSSGMRFASRTNPPMSHGASSQDSSIRAWVNRWKGLWVAVLCASSAAAQVFSAGVKGGTPLSSSTVTGLVGGRSGSGPSALNVRRYTIGPTFEVALPFKLRIEVDALYKRLDTTEHRFFNPQIGTISRLATNSWEFPMLLKRVWLRGPVRPFAVAGGAFRRINSMEGSTERFTGGFQ